MRILVVTAGYFSGRGNYVAEQVRSLRAADVDVDVIFFDPRKTRLNYALTLPRIVRAVGSGRYDLIHTHATYTMIMIEMARRWTRLSIPVVFTNHESEIVDREGRSRSWHPSSWLRHSLRVKQFAARRADFMIFVWQSLVAGLAVDRPHEVIPCGVDLDKFSLLDQLECRRQLGLPADRPVIFFPPSPQNHRKRFQLAREVFERVRVQRPDALLVTGGAIDADTMPVYYNAADVMLQTSLSESSPTVVKEALACEVPVVSTDVGDTQDLIQGVPQCWVCSEDTGELAERVVQVIGHRAEGGRDHLRDAGLGLDQVAQKVIQVYRRVLRH